MSTNVRVIASQSNRIRAWAAMYPTLTDAEIAKELGFDRRVVELALSKGDTRRVKSVAAS